MRSAFPCGWESTRSAASRTVVFVHFKAMILLFLVISKIYDYQKNTRIVTGNKEKTGK
jgi:hypothetical protein